MRYVYMVLALLGSDQMGLVADLEASESDLIFLTWHYISCLNTQRNTPSKYPVWSLLVGLEVVEDVPEAVELALGHQGFRQCTFGDHMEAIIVRNPVVVYILWSLSFVSVTFVRLYSSSRSREVLGERDDPLRYWANSAAPPWPWEDVRHLEGPISGRKIYKSGLIRKISCRCHFRLF